MTKNAPLWILHEYILTCVANVLEIVKKKKPAFLWEFA